MTADIRDVVNTAPDVVGLGEPTHREPAFGHVRNEVFAQLVDRGFRSIALETDRVAALAVNDFVQGGAGTLDAVMRDGFTHGFGAFPANRQLIAWMREYNADRAAGERLAFHGIDAPLEFTAASPRRDLEYAGHYLGVDLDLAGLVGDDEQWSSAEAVMDPAQSPGDTPAAHRLRAIADDMFTLLYAHAPELIAASSRADWQRAKAHLISALGLLRYHRQAAQRIGDSARWSGLSGVRDALMAQNLLDIREIEAGRGPTLAFAHNLHLQRTPSHMSMAGMDITWSGAGAVVGALLENRYTFIAGSPRDDDKLRSTETELDTNDGLAPGEFTWCLRAADVASQLDQATLEGADAVLHIDVSGSGARH
ncbi:erythromycin esterase family protein [Phytoactinopolyspora limicola]|uniref:erythromycin esterase family protein n=1 Tax=Phytoactinopolyspora limicola TaxID=2715536 RepID=UPI00140D4490|nr:erythromycin esterase family protein [Phytoactinopolyspora limicola]